MNRGWSGDNVGDFYLGAKYNFWSEYRQQPAAIALRGMFKAPTGDDDSGASTGSSDFIIDAVFSKEYAARGVEVAGNAGWEFRGSPDDIEIPGGAFRWGIGAAVGSRSALRGTFELNGTMPSGDTTTPLGTVIGIDGSIAPLTTDTGGITRGTVGLTYQARNGFFIGGGISMNLPLKDREDVDHRRRRVGKPRRLLGLAGPDRLPPGRARLRPAAAYSGAEASTGSRAGQPSADCDGAV